MGRFIGDAYPDRDIRRYHEVDFEETDKERQGRSAMKVMVAYERWLKNADAERQRELAFLRLTGLFDRPITPDCLAVLRSAPAIPGLTDTIVPLTDRQWNTALRRLKSIDLLSLSDSENPKSQTNRKSEIKNQKSVCRLRRSHRPCLANAQMDYGQTRSPHHRAGPPDAGASEAVPSEPVAERGPLPLYLADVHLCAEQGSE